METTVKTVSGKSKTLRYIFTGVFVVFVSVLVLVNREHFSQIAGWGYPGIFITSLLSSATLLLPAPGVLITATMGAVFNPFWVAIAAGSGAALGEVTGYLAGYSGQAVVEKKSLYIRVVVWMKRYGDVTILILAFIPNPFFDIAGVAAGMLKMPLYRFLLWCCIGKILKMMVFAYSGLALSSFLG